MIKARLRSRFIIAIQNSKIENQMAMTRRRWIADEVKGDRAALTGAHAVHLVRVLRAKVGQQFDIATGENVRAGVISLISPNEDRVEFSLGDAINISEHAEITLLLSIFKFDRMEWAIEKCTELGIGRIIPIVARRTDIHLAKAAEKRVERWRRIATQASEQSRRNFVPTIEIPGKLTHELLQGVTGTKIVLAESENQSKLRDLIDFDTAEAITLAIGPEGGWTGDELKIFSECGWKSASLGSTILRAETAAIAALAICVA